MLLAFADGFAHQNGRCRAQTEAHHQKKAVQVAHNGVGGQHFHGVVRIAQNHRQQGVAKTPCGLIQNHRGGIFQKPPGHVHAGVEQGGQIQRNDPAADGADHADRKLADAGQQGGNGRTGHPQRGKAAVAENQQVVQPGVHQCGKAEQLHAEGGVLHAALGAGIDGREHIEHIGKTDDSQIRRTQQGQLVTVGQQIHHLHGEQEKHHCQHNGNARADEGGHADGAVDAAGIPFAPVLADQNPQPALHAEYDADEQKDRDVGGGDCCHLFVA